MTQKLEDVSDVPVAKIDYSLTLDSAIQIAQCFDPTTRPDPIPFGHHLAIETYWHGWRFRSRLEARWAIFFTHMGIEFQYEPEGYILDRGIKYLPDYYLPAVDMWAEVKGRPLNTKERQKCRALADRTVKACLYLDGPPDFRSYVGVVPIYLDAEHGTELMEISYSLDIEHYNARLYRAERRLFSCPDQHGEKEFSPRYRDAVYAARGERFEEAA